MPFELAVDIGRPRVAGKELLTVEVVHGDGDLARVEAGPEIIAEDVGEMVEFGNPGDVDGAERLHLVAAGERRHGQDGKHHGAHRSPPSPGAT